MYNSPPDTLDFRRKPAETEFNIYLKAWDGEYWQGMEFGDSKEEAINFARMDDAIKHAKEQAALYGQAMFIEVEPCITQ